MLTSCLQQQNMYFVGYTNQNQLLPKYNTVQVGYYIIYYTTEFTLYAGEDGMIFRAQNIVSHWSPWSFSVYSPLSSARKKF